MPNNARRKRLKPQLAAAVTAAALLFAHLPASAGPEDSLAQIFALPEAPDSQRIQEIASYADLDFIVLLNNGLVKIFDGAAWQTFSAAEIFQAPEENNNGFTILQKDVMGFAASDVVTSKEETAGATFSLHQRSQAGAALFAKTAEGRFERAGGQKNTTLFSSCQENGFAYATPPLGSETCRDYFGKSDGAAFGYAPIPTLADLVAAIEGSAAGDIALAALFGSAGPVRGLEVTSYQEEIAGRTYQLLKVIASDDGTVYRIRQRPLTENGTPLFEGDSLRLEYVFDSAGLNRIATLTGPFNASCGTGATAGALKVNYGSEAGETPVLSVSGQATLVPPDTLTFDCSTPGAKSAEVTIDDGRTDAEDLDRRLFTMYPAGAPGAASMPADTVDDLATGVSAAVTGELRQGSGSVTRVCSITDDDGGSNISGSGFYKNGQVLTTGVTYNAADADVNGDIIEARCVADGLTDSHYLTVQPTPCTFDVSAQPSYNEAQNMTLSVTTYSPDGPCNPTLSGAVPAGTFVTSGADNITISGVVFGEAQGVYTNTIRTPLATTDVSYTINNNMNMNGSSETSGDVSAGNGTDGGGNGTTGNGSGGNGTTGNGAIIEAIIGGGSGGGDPGGGTGNE